MSPSSFLESNLAVLAVRLPGLACLLRASSCVATAGVATAGVANAGVASAGAVTLEVLPAAGGNLPSARLGGRWLHSAYDPQGEASRLAQSVSSTVDVLVLFGFGLGYVAEALLGFGGKEAPVDKVLVCEADAASLASCLSVRDLTGVLGSESLGFLVGGSPSALITALDDLRCRHPSVLALGAVEKAWPEWFADLRTAVERFSAKESINQNTLTRFGRLWVRNLAKNLPLIGSLPGTKSLEGRFSGFPALVVAAGPSLDEVLPRLSTLRERFLVICVDTALRSLLRVGIEPDFLVVVDPQYWNWRHLEGLASPSSILVSESAAWPPCFRFSGRATFLCASLFPLGKAIEAKVGEKGALGAGGSVATTAWDLARVLGASPIYMAGLDLSFPEGKTHAQASLFEQRALASGSRLAPAETGQTAALFGGGGLWSGANDGALVRTDKRMTLYAWWFESRLARAASPPTFSLSSHGLRIPGMGVVGVAELEEGRPRRDALDPILDEIASMVEDGDALARAALGLDELKAALEGAFTSSTRAAAEAAAARAELLLGKDPREHLEALDRLDAELLAGSAGDVIGFLLPPLHELVGERAKDLAESLLRSEQLYTRVADSAGYHLDALTAGGGKP